MQLRFGADLGMDGITDASTTLEPLPLSQVRLGLPAAFATDLDAETKRVFDAAVENAQRLRNSVAAEAVLLGLVYVNSVFVWQYYGALDVATWQAVPGEGGRVLSAVNRFIRPASEKALAESFMLFGFLSEIFMRATGFNGGMGGSMHAFFLPFGAYPNNAIVGASAGISGVLGALLCLKLLKRIDLPASFFVINLGLNIAITFVAPGVDWAAHLGGLIDGMVICAALDGFEMAVPKLMRCKFPEFVKLNLGVLIAVVAWLADFSPLTMLTVLVGLIILAKGIDVALSLPRGLALTVAILAASGMAASIVGAVSGSPNGGASGRLE